MIGEKRVMGITAGLQRMNFVKNSGIAGVAPLTEMKAGQRRENTVIIFTYVAGYSQGKE